MESLRVICAGAVLNKLDSRTGEDREAVSMPRDNSRGRCEELGFDVEDLAAEFIPRAKIDMRAQKLLSDLRGRSSRFILAAEVKEKLAARKLDRHRQSPAWLGRFSADRWSLFRARQTKIEVRRLERFGKTSAFSLREIFRCQHWPRYSKTRFSSDTTAEFRSLPRPRAQIAFCFSVRPIRKFGRRGTKVCK